MKYDRIYPCDFVNGPGCRVVLFVTGCIHKCQGCYNKSTWNPCNGETFNSNTVKEIAEHLSKPYIQGLTLTGGDPLYRGNREDIEALVKWVKARFPKKDIWMWTGYKFEDIKHLELLKYIDVIIDGKYEQDNPTDKPWRGSDNQRLWKQHNEEWLNADSLSLDS
ncbi:anaerobic ribonucleotide reductase small subunit [Salmonella phage STML-198]|uniref:Anaerobic ribonucleoside-triphosphate reductase-activating protein n=3 Tax=Gelderlandvirus TaxID=1913653 RepID=K4I612_9CAUD|nr:anaerobic ribonucleotide reductase small subunit [Salmonella phage STP4-a]YP_009148057.1 anaerobic ribonucleotide reductase small subunit [Salmonella phage STML-198]YP_009615550.1 anaerobic ribonucleotide reductase small subunit [Salmonella phage Melville]UFK27192.1 anaerobic ribonucleoside-triphosphate reductase-activating protein [Escherichia phage UoN_LG358_1]AFU64015.1 ribonucleotide reductase of class III (anaerobic) activating protein [Salmonella phage STML-198]AHJ86921.2 anaerobic ri